MSRKTRWFGGGALLAAAVAVGSWGVAPTSSAGSCTGTYYIYYETAACQVEVGGKVSCPGYPDQIDSGPDGTYQQTPYFTTQSVSCPCPSGGGGSGGGETGEDGPG